MSILKPFSCFLIIVGIAYRVIQHLLDFSVNTAYLRLSQSPPNFTYCYKVNSSTIVFLHLTNDSDEWNDLDACAFRTAAVKNPDCGVCVLTKARMKPHPSFKWIPNIEMAPLDIDYILNGVPILDWYQARVLNETKRGRYSLWETSDSLRYAYLYKYGGRYLDSDMLTLRGFDGLQK